MSSSPALEELERGIRVMLEGVKRIREANDWVDQNHSPLTKRAFLDAVRRGDLAGRKVGGQIFVRRDELDAFIEKHRAAKAAPSDAEEEELAVERALKYEGRRRRSA